MNDFTKEELQSIWRWADAHSDKQWYENLAKKIKPLIENYCEHEFQIKSFSPHFLMMCDKCGKTFVDGSFPG